MVDNIRCVKDIVIPELAAEEALSCAVLFA